MSSEFTISEVVWQATANDNDVEAFTLGEQGPAGPGAASQFVVLAATGDLSNERVLTAGTGVSIADAGAGKAVTVSLSTSGVDADTYGSAALVPQITVDAYGRLTSAENVYVEIGYDKVSGLGSMAIQNANAVAITGGTIAGAGVTCNNQSGQRLGIIETKSGQSLQILHGGNPTATRDITINVNDVGRTLAFTADATIGGTNSGNETMSFTFKLFTALDVANIRAPVAGTITRATIHGTTLAGATVSGSAVVDVRKDSSFPATTSIAASAKPTITGSAAPTTDATLTGWSKTFSAGDWLSAKLDSVTTFESVTLQLEYTR